MSYIEIKVSFIVDFLVNNPRMTEVNLHEAKTHLSKLLRKVAEGETIVICRSGKRIAKLVPLHEGPRKFGLDEGVVEVPDDFDDDLPATVLDAFES